MSVIKALLHTVTLSLLLVNNTKAKGQKGSIIAKDATLFRRLLLSTFGEAEAVKTALR